jgi:hypothetical protein
MVNKIEIVEEEIAKEDDQIDCLKPESVKLKNQISSKVSLQAKNKAKSSHSKCTQKVHENWNPPCILCYN